MKYVDGIVTVTEAEIASAILMLLEKHKMVAEGAGAVSVAAAMTNKVDIKGKNVVCVVSGGNVDVNVLDRIIDKGLQENGRIAEFSVMMADKPGHSAAADYCTDRRKHSGCKSRQKSKRRSSKQCSCKRNR